MQTLLHVWSKCLGAATSSETWRVFPCDYIVWECNGKQLCAVHPTSLKREISVTHPPTCPFLKTKHFKEAFKCLLLEIVSSWRITDELGRCNESECEVNKQFLNHICHTLSGPLTPDAFIFITWINSLKVQKAPQPALQTGSSKGPRSAWGTFFNLTSWSAVWKCDGRKRNATALTQHPALHGPGW